MPSNVIVGKTVSIIKARMILAFFKIGFSISKNPFIIRKAIKKFIRLKKELVNEKPFRKLVKVDGRYYWDLTQPGWPSLAWNQNAKWIMSRLIENDKGNIESVRMVFFAITKKCPMNCEHCYEWDEINKKETLDIATMKKIVAKYQNLGAAYFILGGGEPLVRYHDLIELLKSGNETSEFWITTSGFNLTESKALELKRAGLKGVSISMDKHEAASNNKFRGHKDATHHVEQAIRNAKKVGLVTALALCATKEYIDSENANIYSYGDAAAKLGADFIWVIEPRAVGRYEGKDVQLTDDQFELINDFSVQLNYNSNYSSYPRVVFPNYAHRKKGCAGAGKNSIMIDTDGFVSPCPFCRTKGIFALDDNAKDELMPLFNAGCLKFETRQY